MEIKLLKPGYKTDEKFYKKFLKGDLQEYYSDKSVYIDEAPSFPLYYNVKDDAQKERLFLKSVEVISKYYYEYDADILLSEVFWHSLFCIYKRDYILKTYPKVKEDYKSFKNIVIKDFDWENYIYKSLFAVKYVTNYTSNPLEQEKYYKAIINNTDVYNYVLKYPIFRNGDFVIKVLQIIESENLSEYLKEKISVEQTGGKDLRRGREVIYEFNKSYPIILSPMLDVDELKIYFNKFLSYYQ